jgi:hypothetical protein
LKQAGGQHSLKGERKESGATVPLCFNGSRPLPALTPDSPDVLIETSNVPVPGFGFRRLASKPSWMLASRPGPSDVAEHAVERARDAAEIERLDQRPCRFELPVGRKPRSCSPIGRARGSLAITCMAQLLGAVIQFVFQFDATA